MLAVFRSACPSCGGPISDERLQKGGVCSRCLPHLPASPSLDSLCTLLPDPRNLRAFCEALSRTREFEAFFTRATGFAPLPLQKTWSRRIFLGQSFAISAPPGMGKTTWLLALALHHPGKVLILVPTRLLGAQVRNRLHAFTERTGVNRSVLLYESRKSSREAFERGTFDILVGTVQFFHRRFDDLVRIPFDLVLIDDVDAFLKKGRGVDRLLDLLGFPEWARKKALRAQLSEEEEIQLNRIRKKVRTRVVMSSATFRPHPRTTRLLHRLLGLDVQQAASTLREVVDVLEKASVEEALERIPEIVKFLGEGGLLLVSELHGREKVQDVVEHLRGKGLKVLSYLEHDAPELMEKMAAEPFHLAVGLAHPQNPLVRGVDLPEVLRYVLFLDPPVRRIPLTPDETPPRLFSLLLLMLPLLEGEENVRARTFLRRLRPLLGLSRTERYTELLTEIAGFVRRHLDDPDFQEKLRNRPDVALGMEGARPVAFVGDATTYIQATGRTSRLLRGRMTRGFSLIFFEHEKAMNSLIRRLRLQFMHQDVSFRPLEEVDLSLVRRELDESRTGEGESPNIPATLVVVESPTKARTLASFFGKPQMRRVEDAVVYEIPAEGRHLLFAASLGHVTDLVRDVGRFGVVRGGNEGYVPTYDTLKRCLHTGEQVVDREDLARKCGGRFRDKKDLLAGLRQMAFEVNEVFVATDPDAEGEKIAWDLTLWLKPIQPYLRRAEFHEITPRAFREALQSPRDVNMNRVKAQLARRILDRWVGFTLSQELWRVFHNPRLSAGRVQTPVLGWVIGRADASKKKVPEVQWVVGNATFRRRFASVEEAKVFKASLEKGAFTLQLGEARTEVRHPSPPFTTDRILVEANRKLGMTAKEVMEHLQELFERGFITYHRTDSTHVSLHGRYQVAKPWITEHFGEEAFSPRAWGEEGTHEAIRPTRPLSPEDLEEQVAAGLVTFRDGTRAVALYELIFHTFMASQMKPAKVRVAPLRLVAGKVEVEEEVIVGLEDPGFFQLAGAPLIFEKGPVRGIALRQVPAARPFTQGELVAEMKRRGLGRPSTYAMIVDTLLARKYVVERRGLLFPTPLGRKVYAWLSEHHPDLVSEELTRNLEATMDRIEQGEASLRETLQALERRIRPLISDHSGSP